MIEYIISKIINTTDGMTCTDTVMNTTADIMDATDTMATAAMDTTDDTTTNTSL